MSGEFKATLQGQSRKLGLPPGTIVYVGEARDRKPHISLMEYAVDSFRETSGESLSCYSETPATPGAIRWINIDGLSDVALLEEIGRHFGIHPLTLEDIANTNQRPKYDLFGQYAFVTFKMLRLDAGQNSIIAEHVGLVIGEHFVLSFQEAPGDVFDIVRERIRAGKGKIRQMGGDYLVYSLLDAVIDGYFSVLELLGDRISELDDLLAEGRTTPEILREIHNLKRQVIYIRRCAWPMRELISGIQKMPSALFSETIVLYMRDLYDHAVQALDTVETYRDLLSSLTDLYMSISGIRMNEVMKVLTIIATIFIPLTFLAGVYGMNFEYMPELHYKWAYPVTLLVMFLTAGGMAAYFRKKGWF